MGFSLGSLLKRSLSNSPVKRRMLTEMDERKTLFLTNPLFFSFFFLLTVLPLFISNSDAEDDRRVQWGFSISGGFPQGSTPNLTRWAFLPRVDLPLHKYWDLEFEGNFSYYDMSRTEDLYVLGLNVNILFKPIQWNRGSLFLLAGTGLGYDNSTNSNHKTWEIGNSHVAGNVQGGLGISHYIGKGWGFRGEFRFNHISDPFKPDPGINTYNFLIGLSF